MNIKKIALVLGVVGLTTGLQAQKADAKSSALLDGVIQKYKQNKNTYFKFTYGTGANGKVGRTQTGIYYTTPSAYKLKIMDIEQIFDGSKVYNISQEDNEVTIAKADGSQMMFSPTSYLNNYKKDFNTQYVGKRTVNGVSTDLVKMTPVKNNGIRQVYIYLDAAKKQLVKLEQYSTSNDVAVIAISDYKANQNLSSSLFTFNKSDYPNYLITEL